MSDDTTRIFVRAAGLAKAIPVPIGVMMPVAIFALTKLAVPLYVNRDR